MTRSSTILGIDGNHVSVSETTEEDEYIISIQQNDEQGRIATVRLNSEQLIELENAIGDLLVESDET